MQNTDHQSQFEQLAHTLGELCKAISDLERSSTDETVVTLRLACHDTYGAFLGLPDAVPTSDDIPDIQVTSASESVQAQWQRHLCEADRRLPTLLTSMNSVERSDEIENCVSDVEWVDWGARYCLAMLELEGVDSVDRSWACQFQFWTNLGAHLLNCASFLHTVAIPAAAH